MVQGNTPAVLGEAAFEAIATLAHQECGLKIVPEKMMMVQSRLRHRLRALNLSNFEEYSELVQSHHGTDERRQMISALTTNVSHFFREPHHFDILSSNLLPSIRHRIKTGERIRIWSAGCSNGQEPYSIAMHLFRLVPEIAHADFKILATDIDPKVVDFARQGAYSSQLLSGVSESDKSKFLDRQGDSLIVDEQLRKCISFRELNLLSEWPMQQRFDAIFCRNVVIYFDIETQEKLWPRFNAALPNDGLFFLGHSERIAIPQSFGFSSIGPTAYKKINNFSQTNQMQKGEFHGST